MSQRVDLFPNSPRVEEFRVTGKVPCGAMAPDPQSSLNVCVKKQSRENTVLQVKCPVGLRHLINNLISVVIRIIKKKQKEYRLSGKVAIKVN